MSEKAAITHRDPLPQAPLAPIPLQAPPVAILSIYSLTIP
jgi:hypothetical protein